MLIRRKSSEGHRGPRTEQARCGSAASAPRPTGITAPPTVTTALIIVFIVHFVDDEDVEVALL